MTDRLNTIKANSARVITNNLSEEWGFRRLTSKYGAEPRVYDAYWTPFNCLLSTGSVLQSYDDFRRTHRKVSSQRIRHSYEDPEIPLSLGDQVQDPNGVVWAIAGSPTSGPGTVAYDIVRDEAMLGDEKRDGGI